MADDKKFVENDAETPNIKNPPPPVVGVESPTMFNLPAAPRTNDVSGLTTAQVAEAKILADLPITEAEAAAIVEADKKSKVELNAKPEDALTKRIRISKANEALIHLSSNDYEKVTDSKGIITARPKSLGTETAEPKKIPKEEEIEEAPKEEKGKDDVADQYRGLTQSLETKIATIYRKNPSSWTQEEVDEIVGLQDSMNNLMPVEHHAFKTLKELAQRANPNLSFSKHRVAPKEETSLKTYTPQEALNEISNYRGGSMTQEVYNSIVGALRNMGGFKEENFYALEVIRKINNLGFSNSAQGN